METIKRLVATRVESLEIGLAQRIHRAVKILGVIL